MVEKCNKLIIINLHGKKYLWTMFIEHFQTFQTSKFLSLYWSFFFLDLKLINEIQNTSVSLKSRCAFNVLNIRILQLFELNEFLKSAQHEISTTFQRVSNRVQYFQFEVFTYYGTHLISIQYYCKSYWNLWIDVKIYFHKHISIYTEEKRLRWRGTRMRKFRFEIVSTWTWR